MQKRKTLTVLMLALLAIAVVAPVYASYATAVMYTKFNSTDWTDYELDQNYTAVTIDIRNYLNYNVTGTWAKVAFTNQTGETGTTAGINLIFSDDDETVKVYYINGATEIELASGTYDHGTSGANASVTRLILSNSKVTVYTNYGNRTLQTKILDGFAFSEPISYLRVKGSDLNTAQGGYVQVNVNTGVSGVSGSTTNIVMEFIPVIVTFAMLGMVLGLLKKFGKI